MTTAPSGTRPVLLGAGVAVENRAVDRAAADGEGRPTGTPGRSGAEVTPVAGGGAATWSGELPSGWARYHPPAAVEAATTAAATFMPASCPNQPAAPAPKVAPGPAATPVTAPPASVPPATEAASEAGTGTSEIPASRRSIGTKPGRTAAHTSHSRR
jgi:hypothetical protein